MNAWPYIAGYNAIGLRKCTKIEKGAKDMTKNPCLAPDPLLTEKEVAAVFRVTPETLRAWRRRGALPFVKIGGTRLRYRRSVIAALMEAPR